MTLYLVQHGAAVPEQEDPERPLSAQGAEDVERLAGLLAHLGVSVARVLHSGKTRAAQTAAKLAELYPADTARGYKVGDIRGAFTLSKPL